MRIAVTGGTSVVGRVAVPALVAAGHDVVALTRTPEQAAVLEEGGAQAVLGSMFDHGSLVAVFDGADAVGNFATQVPVGYQAMRPGAWRTNDRLCTEGVRRVVDAAREVCVRRVVQESVSLLYADQGDEWITEDSLLDITRATEPASVAEAQVQEYASGPRVGVVLRFGMIVGDDEMTRHRLRSIRRGGPIGLGAPDGWAHVIHTEDLGTAVVAAFGAPTGIYNAGAEPVRRVELVGGYSEVAGRESVDFVTPLMVRLAGSRLEPMTRSLRVSSERLSERTGWSPARPRFEASWFDVLEPIR